MNDLTAIIISFHSDEKIFDCINSIGKNIKIIVIENSNDLILKEKLELNYRNVKCILSKKNLGYAAGNNLALSLVDTKYALIINPDVILKNDTIDKFTLISKDYPEFGIIAPISKNEKYDNLDILNDKKIKEVSNVKGFAMFVNMKEIKKINYFDENFFLYFEEIDLCKRFNLAKIKILIDPLLEVHHVGGSSHNTSINYQMEISRNWHWMWSTFYYHRKHYGYFFALIKIFPKFLSALLKMIINSVLFKKNKSLIYKHRVLGIINSVLLNKSWYRPKF